MQKLNITSSLFKLKNQEVEKRKVCDCRINRKEIQYCKINHDRHNFVRSKCDELFSKLGNLFVSTDGAKKRETFGFGARRKMYSCNQCDKEFTKQGHLKKHKKNEHREKR